MDVTTQEELPVNSSIGIQIFIVWYIHFLVSLLHVYRVTGSHPSPPCRRRKTKLSATHNQGKGLRRSLRLVSVSTDWLFLFFCLICLLHVSKILLRNKRQHIVPLSPRGSIQEPFPIILDATIFFILYDEEKILNVFVCWRGAVWGRAPDLIPLTLPLLAALVQDAAFPFRLCCTLRFVYITGWERVLFFI